MLELASDPTLARQQMHGLIFYLTTFGYIDGDLDPNEIEYIRETIRRVVERRVEGLEAVDDAVREEVVQEVTEEFEGVFDSVLGEVTQLFNEAVAEAERQRVFVTSRLKQRCFEIFQGFEPAMQEELLAAADELLMADGRAHPAELELRNELSALLQSDDELPLELTDVERRVEVEDGGSRPSRPSSHPLFAQIETHYAADEATRREQLDADRRLVWATLKILEEQRGRGQGKLAGVSRVDDLSLEEACLDQFVYALPPRPGPGYDVTVIGDLHGCYSCVKAALMQSGFLEKVAAFKKAPEESPSPRLIFLGDYLDRGRYSFEGVLRLVLQLFTSFPEHVHVLRGNHELFLEHEGQIVSAVQPAEAISRLRPHAPVEVLADYQRLFNALPSMLLCGRLLFVHGGVPRDALSWERVQDLAALNDWDVRFQMMWSDPSMVDVIPRALQESTYRFGFGKLQCLAFLQRLGCHTLVRGHEHVIAGFCRNYDDDRILAVTVFSAGGANNEDVPEESDFRRVQPMALTVQTTGELDAPSRIEAWPIDFAGYNDAAVNGFFGVDPELT